MVLALVRNVSAEIVQLRLADGERAVSVCQANDLYSSPLVFIHLEEPVLSSSMSLLIEIVRLSEHAI
jgi:hypothetical protein